jgi:hypothetical protein
MQTITASEARQGPGPAQFFCAGPSISLLYLGSSTEIQSGIAHSKKVIRVFEFESSMLKTHKFQIGQTVCFTSRPIGHMAVNDTYLIVKLLPSDGEDYQYRIKSANEAFERVAKESQLDRY